MDQTPVGRRQTLNRFPNILLIMSISVGLLDVIRSIGLEHKEYSDKDLVFLGRMEFNIGECILSHLGLETEAKRWIEIWYESPRSSDDLHIVSLESVRELLAICENTLPVVEKSKDQIVGMTECLTRYYSDREEAVALADLLSDSRSIFVTIKSICVRALEKKEPLAVDFT